MSETWLTSDLHLGHEKVARIRGFETVAEHDETILRNLARKVRDGDQLFILGDVVMGANAVRKVYSRHRIRSRVGGSTQVWVVLGNHDRPHPMHRNAHTHVKDWLAHFDAVITSATLRHRGTTYLLSHFPYDGEGATRPDDEDRLTQWRLRDEGVPLIHGHVHDDVRHRLSRLGTPMHHVGLDAWGLSPVTIHDAVMSR